MLLNRRFSPFLEHSPVAVDSGLKAIQQLRTQVFDLILMDIQVSRARRSLTVTVSTDPLPFSSAQMPFLSGLDCTKRIRSGSDGILEVNRTAAICAVTTCVGQTASSTYREAAFSGLIAKPVTFQAMSDFIIPLSKEALQSQGEVEKISPLGDGNFVFPPLPPSFLENERTFFDTTTSTAVAVNDKHVGNEAPEDQSALAISNSENFAALLAAQTRASLRKVGAVFIARTGTVSGSSLPRSKWEGNMDSSGDLPNLGEFNEETFDQQLAKEMEAVRIFDSNQVRSKLPGSISSSLSKRPPPRHRLSSPAFMDSSPEDSDCTSSDEEAGSGEQVKHRSSDQLQRHHNLASPKAVRPSIRPLDRKPTLLTKRSRSTTSTPTSSFNLAYSNSSLGGYDSWDQLTMDRLTGPSPDATTVHSSSPDMSTSPLDYNSSSSALFSDTQEKEVESIGVGEHDSVMAVEADQAQQLKKTVSLEAQDLNRSVLKRIQSKESDFKSKIFPSLTSLRI